MRHFFYFITLFIFTLSSASAEEKITKHKAISFIGIPKYGNDFKHLDYTNPNAPKGGVLKRSVIGSFDTLNPFILQGTSAKGKEYVFESLMSRVWDEPFSLYGLVAEYIEFSEDHSWVGYHIRKEARFHDGSPITSEDVAFSFNTIREHSVRYKTYFKGITRVETNGPSYVRFYLDSEKSSKETPFLLSMMSILSKKYFDGKDFKKTGLTPIMGSGPYKIKDVKAGKFVTYEKVADYWGKDIPQNKGMYNFQTVVFDYYRDSTAEFESFKAGAFDIRRENDGKKWRTQYDFPKIKSGDIKVEALPEGFPSGMRAFVFNTRKDFFKDKRVRQALNYMFDFDWVNKNLFHNAYARTYSIFDKSKMSSSLEKPNSLESLILDPYKDKISSDLFNSTYKEKSEKIEKQSFRNRLRLSKKLLKEAGWSIKNNKLTHTNGTIFKFEILLRDPNHEKVALSFAKNLEKLGIDVFIRTVDSSQYQERLTHFDFDMILYRWIVTLSPGEEQKIYWGSEAATKQGTRNYAGIQSPVVDGLIEQLGKVNSAEELTMTTRAMDRVLMDGYYFIPLYHRNKAWVAYNASLQRPDIIPEWGYVIEAWWHKK